MQQGICKNCGSIVFVDEKKEKCHCLFCNCVFPSAEALEIAKNPADYDFPNEEQPEYISEEAPRNYDVAFKKMEMQQKKREKVVKPKFQVVKKSIPDVKLSKKQIFTMTAIFVVLIAVFLAITLPLTMKRDQQRAVITEKFQQSKDLGDLKKSIDFEEGFVLSNMDNSHLDLITNEKLSKEQVKKIFLIFSEVRAEVLEEKGEVDYVNNFLRVAVPNQGGYLIKNKTIEDLADLEQITELP